MPEDPTTSEEGTPRAWRMWLMDYAHETGRSLDEVFVALTKAKKRLARRVPPQEAYLEELAISSLAEVPGE
jgi:hypothetical protein